MFSTHDKKRFGVFKPTRYIEGKKGRKKELVPYITIFF